MVSGHGLGGPVSVAVRRDQPELVKQIDQALQAMQGDIDALAQKYGFPRGKPVALERTSAWRGAAEPALAQRATAPLPSLVWHGEPAHWHTVADAAASAPKPARKPSTAANKTAKGKAETAAATTPAPAAPTQTAALDPAAAEGRQKFNDVCSHCHSPDGASPMRERDLRRLKLRYDDKWVETALKTINEGRPQLGMPTWKGQLKDDEIERIVSFLKTIQK
jgi:mono/diheme cytochrome c family protein